MSSLITAITTILSLLYSVIRFGRDTASRFNIFKKNREIKKEYQQGREAVKDGDVEKINDIIRGK